MPEPSQRGLIRAAIEVHVGLNPQRLGIQHFRIGANLVLIAIAGNTEILVGLGRRLDGDEHAFPGGLQIDPFLPHFQGDHRLGIAAQTDQRLRLFGL